MPTASAIFDDGTVVEMYSARTCAGRFFPSIALVAGPYRTASTLDASPIDTPSGNAGCRVDYHVEVDDHYYSVPFRLLRETVDARLTDTTVEVFHKGIRVASHPRSSVRIGTRQYPSTCRVRTAATPRGRRNA